LKNASRYGGINHPDEIGTSIHTLSIFRLALKLHFVQNVEPDIPPLREAKGGVLQRSLRVIFNCVIYFNGKDNARKII